MRYTLWLLTIVNLLNYLDRYIIASAAPKIQEEFDLSNAETGLIMSAFMIGFMFTSPFFGWLADRKARPALMGAGVLGWSAATALTGWVSSFIPLFLSRVGVGIGEGSYATIAPAYIRDQLQNKEKLNKAMALFYLAIPIGAAAGYMWGGYISEHFHWRWAFYLGALPGLFFGVAVWLLKDVPRTDTHAARGESSFMASMKDLWTNREYRLTVIGYTAHTFGLGGFAAWAPHYCANTLGVSLSEASFKIGAITCIAGVVGTVIGGKWGDRFVDHTKADGAATARGLNTFCAAASLFAMPFAFWVLFAGSMNTFMIAMLFVQVGMFAALAPINTATLSAVPAKVASTAFAIQIFVIHALGDVISPPLVGWLGDRIPMNHAMTVLSVAIGVSAIVWWFNGRKNKSASI
jgi:MFS family permease